jgi:hypothetical protein
MDERKIKRLAAILVMAIIAIMFFKFLLTRAVTNLGNAAMEKKHAAMLSQATVPASGVPAISESGVEAASPVLDTSAAAAAATPATN